MTDLSPLKPLSKWAPIPNDTEDNMAPSPACLSDKLSDNIGSEGALSIGDNDSYNGADYLDMEDDFAENRWVLSSVFIRWL